MMNHKQQIFQVVDKCQLPTQPILQTLIGEMTLMRLRGDFDLLRKKTFSSWGSSG